MEMVISMYVGAFVLIFLAIGLSKASRMRPYIIGTFKLSALIGGSILAYVTLGPMPIICLLLLLILASVSWVGKTA